MKDSFCQFSVMTRLDMLRLILSWQEKRMALENTGSYFVYLLHPVMGSTHFTLEPGNSYTGWEKIGGAVWLKDDIVQEVFDAIEARKTKSTGKLS
jgi:hypothetical protein